MVHSGPVGRRARGGGDGRCGGDDHGGGGSEDFRIFAQAKDGLKGSDLGGESVQSGLDLALGFRKSGRGLAGQGRSRRRRRGRRQRRRGPGTDAAGRCPLSPEGDTGIPFVAGALVVPGRGSPGSRGFLLDTLERQQRARGVLVPEAGLVAQFVGQACVVVDGCGRSGVGVQEQLVIGVGQKLGGRGLVATARGHLERGLRALTARVCGAGREVEGAAVAALEVEDGRGGGCGGGGWVMRRGVVRGDVVRWDVVRRRRGWRWSVVLARVVMVGVLWS